MPVVANVNEWKGACAWLCESDWGPQLFQKARIPIKSQLNVQAWKDNLKGYWDQQLVQLLAFDFALDFSRNCDLKCDRGNHKSALEFPGDVDTYITEELEFGALLAAFEVPPINADHSSPFMTRAKPNSDHCRVIIDLSWPLGEMLELTKTHTLAAILV